MIDSLLVGQRAGNFEKLFLSELSCGLSMPTHGLSDSLPSRLSGITHEGRIESEIAHTHDCFEVGQQEGSPFPDCFNPFKSLNHTICDIITSSKKALHKANHRSSSSQQTAAYSKNGTQEMSDDPSDFLSSDSSENIGSTRNPSRPSARRRPKKRIARRRPHQVKTEWQ